MNVDTDSSIEGGGIESQWPENWPQPRWKMSFFDGRPPGAQFTHVLRALKNGTRQEYNKLYNTEVLRAMSSSSWYTPQLK